MDLEVARNFSIALLIGALVGIEREKKKNTAPASFGGIRTFILLALVGAASAWVSRELAMPWIFAVTLAVVGLAVVASYVRQNRHRATEAPGLTTELAALAVCLLGGMAVAGEATLAVALAVAVSAILAFKQPLHGLVGRIGADDLYAGIKLLIASFIVLPLLPDRPVDPWQALNPYKLWLLVVLISGMSLAGYVAIRWLGATRGAAISGVFGGLTSSTATTLSFARISRDQPSAVEYHALCAGILLAWLVMVLRIVILVAVVNVGLLGTAWVPLAAIGTVTALFALRHYRAGITESQRKDVPALALHNPFSLRSAMRVGALFAVVLLVVHIVQQRASGVGLHVVAALAGLVDTDAIALSLAEGAKAEQGAARAATALAVAALANTVSKCALVLAIGRGGIRRGVCEATAAILIAGVGAVALA